jgi:hypothetical protein
MLKEKFITLNETQALFHVQIICRMNLFEFSEQKADICCDTSLPPAPFKQSK